MYGWMGGRFGPGIGGGKTPDPGEGDDYEFPMCGFVSTDEKTVAWREEQFIALGLPDTRAKLVAPLLAPEGGFLVDLARFRLLVRAGCAPLIAIEILQ